MNEVYNTLTECVEIADRLDAAADGYVSLDTADQDRLKQDLVKKLEAVLAQLKAA